MMNARPCINGNTREDFCEAHAALTDAIQAINHARRVLFNNVLNGRNYQHHAVLESHDKLVADRNRAYAAFLKASELIEAFRADVADAAN